MEYRYQLTKWECLVLTVGLWRKKYVTLLKAIGGIVYWLLLLSYGVMEVVGKLGLEYVWYALCAVGFMLYVGWGYLINTYKSTRQLLGKQEQVIQVRNGKIALGRNQQHMFLLSDILVEKENHRFLILKYFLPGEVFQYIVIPKRVFTNKEECQKLQQTILDASKWNDMYVGRVEIEKEFYMSKAAVHYMMQAVGIKVKDFDKYYKAYIRAGFYPFWVGKRVVRLYQDCLEVQIGGRSFFHSWQGLPRLVKVPGLYLFGYEAGAFAFSIPGCLFKSEEEENAFVGYCQSQGMSLEYGNADLCDIDASEYLTEIEDGRMEEDGAFDWLIRDIKNYIKLRFFISLFVLVFVVLPLLYLTYRPEKKVFCPLEEQKAILEALDISVSEECMEELEEWREYAEGNPFYQILSYMGSSDSGKDIPQLYWFDWESYDIVEGYIDIFDAVEYLSQGELVIEDITIQDEKVDWEKSQGTLGISYICNGTSYECSVVVRGGGWLNENIIRELNKMVKQENPEKRIYYCFDDGQGAILFYKDAEWAKEFEQKTDISLRTR